MTTPRPPHEEGAPRVRRRRTSGPTPRRRASAGSPPRAPVHTVRRCAPDVPVPGAAAGITRWANALSTVHRRDFAPEAATRFPVAATAPERRPVRPHTTVFGRPVPLLSRLTPLCPVLARVCEAFPSPRWRPLLGSRDGPTQADPTSCFTRDRKQRCWPVSRGVGSASTRGRRTLCAWCLRHLCASPTGHQTPHGEGTQPRPPPSSPPGPRSLSLET